MNDGSLDKQASKQSLVFSSCAALTRANGQWHSSSSLVIVRPLSYITMMALTQIWGHLKIRGAHSNT